MRIRRFIAAVAMAAVAIGVFAPAAFAGKPLLPNEMGVKAYSLIEQLTRIDNGDGTYTAVLRVAATQGEIDAAHTVKGRFEDAGYTAEFQPFSYVRGGVTRDSQNVVAYRPADRPRRSGPTPLIIVGAHYDAVSAGAGADDNASGVAVMLEVAERLRKYKTDYDIAFVAFGAEEVGLRGSAYYVSEMSAADVARCAVMINFDSLIVGDKLYIHAGFNEKTWARDEMALETLRLVGHEVPVEPVSAATFPTKAARPRNSVLDCSRAAALGVQLPRWEDGLARFLAERPA